MIAGPEQFTRMGADAMTELRVGIQGCGTIGRYILEGIQEGVVPGARVVAVMGRTNTSRGRQIVEKRGIPWVTDMQAMLAHQPNVVVEAASHAAVEEDARLVLSAGVDFVPLSLGALVDDGLMGALMETAEHTGACLFIPSGGIGGLDALAQARYGEIYDVTMTSRKPPAAWNGIPFVESLGIDLDILTEPYLLFEGPARDCVRKFPQNINIAAALSLAGVGFDRTQIRIFADPLVPINKHEIVCRASSGTFTVTMENAPVPENPKTTYMACLSGLAALGRLRASYRVGT